MNANGKKLSLMERWLGGGGDGPPPPRKARQLAPQTVSQRPSSSP
jgi:hypothetical protein